MLTGLASDLVIFILDSLIDLKTKDLKTNRSLERILDISLVNKSISKQIHFHKIQLILLKKWTRWKLVNYPSEGCTVLEFGNNVAKYAYKYRKLTDRGQIQYKLVLKRKPKGPLLYYETWGELK